MFKAIKRWWKYLGAKLGSSLEEKADPKIQLEQAIQEAQDQHRRLTEQAASVIAHQKQTEMRLARAQEELEKVTANARQALLLVDEQTTKGDTEALDYQSAAESFANRLITLEREVEGLRDLLLESTKNSDAAKAAVKQNSTVLQKKLGEKQKYLSQLDQAKMQEQMNKAVAQLNATVGDDVPTFEQVRQKIEERAARAAGMAELQGSGIETRTLEVEQAQADAEAKARLSALRTQLGLPGPVEQAAPTTAAADPVGPSAKAPTPSPATEPGS